MLRDLRCTLIATAGLLLGGNPALAASFDCARASAPVERAICADPGLSAADEGVALFYRHLQSPACRGTPGVEALVEDQRAWVAATRQAFQPGEDGLKALAAAYAARHRQLDPLVDACGAQRKAVAPLKVEALQVVATANRGASAVPWVQGASPEIGWRIQQAVFDRLLGVPAPARREAARAALAAATSPRPNEIVPISDLAFQVRRNDGRLLILEVSGEGCGAYCEGFTDQLMFDARTGQPVPVADLLTRDGAAALVRRTVEHRLREGRARLAQAVRARQLDRENDEEGTYRQCLRDWAAWARNGEILYPLWLDEKGRWHVHVGRCSAHVNRPHDLLDDLHMPVTLATLRPLMSAYGRSLLLGEGDVRSPVEVVGRCEGPTLPLALAPPVPPGPRLAADETDATWLTAEGRPLVWRHDQASPAEATEAAAGSLGARYVALARGQRFSAGLRADGSLWAWGSNHRGGLGVAGPATLDAPQRLLDDVVQMSVDTATGLALRRDGTLWVWGDLSFTAPPPRGTPASPTPRRVLDNVTQAVWGHRGELLALRRDGSLWRLGGPELTRLDRPPQPPQRLGEGFTRLAGHHAEAAWRADGSLWAWHETLAALAGASETDLPPAVVAADVVQVTAPEIGLPPLLLKTDGSVWAPLGWGGRLAPRRIACGVRALAVAAGPTVLALTTDQRLIAWGAGTAGAGTREAASQFLTRAPVEIGRGFSALWQSDMLWGNTSAVALAQRGPDELWASHSTPDTAVTARMQRLLVPR